MSNYKNVTMEEISKMIGLHKKWLAGDSDGVFGDFSGMNLSGFTFRNRDLRNANFKYSFLHNADFGGADLQGADFVGAKLYNANFHQAKLDPDARIPMICPETGPILGYKKAKYNLIVTLIIPSSALRSSGTTNICRCSKATVVSITHIDGSEYDTITHSVPSLFDDDFIYTVGEVVEEPRFNTDRFDPSGHGIYFYLNKMDAICHE